MKRTARSHYKVFNGQLVPKKSYGTEEQALNVARFLNMQERTIHKMVAYKCCSCGKWHIGSNGRELNREDHERAKYMLIMNIRKNKRK